MAMACGKTRVGTLQCSHHTSELLMSKFAGTPLHDPGYDMRSHQASSMVESALTALMRATVPNTT